MPVEKCRSKLLAALKRSYHNILQLQYHPAVLTYGIHQEDFFKRMKAQQELRSIVNVAARQRGFLF